jgi:hypothetical protein
MISCTKKYTTIDEYSTYQIKYAKTRISFPTKDFSITIPKNWEWEVKKNETKFNILGILINNNDSIASHGKIMVVEKYKSFEKNTDLKTEYESILKNNKESKQHNKIVECGKTKLLKYDAYFIHMISENENSFEQILFIVQSKEKGVFYSLVAGCQLKDELKPNMSMMLNCLESFEYK